MSHDEILTAKEAASLLKLPKRSLDYLVSTNQIPYSRLGKRSVRFARSRLMEWMRDREGVEFQLPRRSG